MVNLIIIFVNGSQVFSSLVTNKEVDEEKDSI